MSLKDAKDLNDAFIASDEYKRRRAELEALQAAQAKPSIDKGGQCGDPQCPCR